LTKASVQKKSARELRQRGSDYRCCIPALAGFVSPQSIAPDGNKLFAKDYANATAFSGNAAIAELATNGSNKGWRQSGVFRANQWFGPVRAINQTGDSIWCGIDLSYRLLSISPCAVFASRFLRTEDAFGTRVGAWPCQSR